MWADLFQFIRDHFSLTNLSIVLDAGEATEYISISRSYYHGMVEVVDEMMVLGGNGLKDLSVRMEGMTDLEVVFENKVLGSRWMDREGKLEKIMRDRESRPGIMMMPSFHVVRDGDWEI